MAYFFESEERSTCFLVPMASFTYRTSLGIRPSSIRLTCPSQRKRLFVSKEYMLGMPACSSTSLCATWSFQVMPKIRRPIAEMKGVESVFLT